MNPPTEIPVRIKSSSGKTTVGHVRVQTWDKKTQTKRAFKFLAACWALAIVSVVLPIAHFFLVPGFFIAGPIGAYIFAQQRSVVLGGEGVCPTCNEVLPIVRNADVWPLEDLCSKCHDSVVIEKTDGK